MIVRSSSPLEADPRWSGAFSSVAEVGQDEVATAVRSCWASAFAVDPLARLDACGLRWEALEIGVLLQPEIRPDFGGVARVQPAAGNGPGPGAMLVSGSGVEVVVEGVAGHPGALLAGWADGAAARVSLPAAPPAGRGPGEPTAGGRLLDLAGAGLVLAVARLAGGIHRVLGDAAIEWAACGGELWLLQSGPGCGPDPSATAFAATACPATASLTTACPTMAPAPAASPVAAPPGRHLAAREWMPALSASVRAHGRHLRGRRPWRARPRDGWSRAGHTNRPRPTAGTLSCW